MVRSNLVAKVRQQAMERAARVAETMAKNSYLALKKKLYFLSSTIHVYIYILGIILHTEAGEWYQGCIETKIKFGLELYVLLILQTTTLPPVITLR